MELESAKLFAMAFAAAIGVIGPGIGLGILVGKSVEAIGRNPDAYGKIFSTMIVGAALTEALGIIALVAAFLIRFL
ncbi:MAG: ATP synthase F0 subunit C [Candidatus Lloydbacteria bacterium RIFCSPHIGHO2_01_FULL_49_22]|uniref:ATP synthase subunit c n=1 Tax=Candidatus Lloydbacteria bacterium RIFCSPHIGHO2_01_FULL_49_22 TaxID=1798658 RepID=A0A1G2CWL5_9BACT|nr:MAG: ATP synthase F0 subunit C [Candidatus Lloydbacteria bacterium RIFCSPHIGHO2_01_FULL_49_22]OGZ10242.1 MAG: ATP synthase F0 subunit C [Candidatus Lloydbacteria bacterium RIFCSPHIGHO2_02_FULL_50_18]